MMTVYRLVLTIIVLIRLEDTSFNIIEVFEQDLAY